MGFTFTHSIFGFDGAYSPINRPKRSPKLKVKITLRAWPPPLFVRAEPYDEEEAAGRWGSAMELRGLICGRVDTKTRRLFWAADEEPIEWVGVLSYSRTPTTVVGWCRRTCPEWCTAMPPCGSSRRGTSVWCSQNILLAQTRWRVSTIKCCT